MVVQIHQKLLINVRQDKKKIIAPMGVEKLCWTFWNPSTVHSFFVRAKTHLQTLQIFLGLPIYLS
jgi:hypothetical protein